MNTKKKILFTSFCISQFLFNQHLIASSEEYTVPKKAAVSLLLSDVEDGGYNVTKIMPPSQKGPSSLSDEVEVYDLRNTITELTVAREYDEKDINKLEEALAAEKLVSKALRSQLAAQDKLLKQTNAKNIKLQTRLTSTLRKLKVMCYLLRLSDKPGNASWIRAVNMLSPKEPPVGKSAAAHKFWT